MVALSASRLVLARDRLNEPHHLPNAAGGHAQRRHGMGSAARVLDGAACDLSRAVGLSGDLADRGGELLDRAGGRRNVAGRDANALLSGAGFGRDLVGGTMQLGGGHFQLPGGFTHLAEGLVDRHLEARDGGGDRIGALLALAIGCGLAGRKPLALDHGVTEDDDGARHRTSSSLASVAGIDAEVPPAASLVIAPVSPLSGRVMLRPTSQLNRRPIKTAAAPTPMMKMRI